MDDPDSTTDDVASPKIQRRLWRRVWIGVAVFLLLMPVLLWVAIDYAGKREWREVQARLRSHGEATTLDELNLPTREEVPDGENFCALPWLIEGDDGQPSQAMAELGEALEIFSGSREQAELLAEARGNPQLGFPSSISALARTLVLAAEEQDFKIDATVMAEAGDDPAARVLTYLKSTDDFWQAAEAARELPRACWLPLYRQRLAANRGRPFAVPSAGLFLINGLNRALTARIAGAFHSGDAETVLTSLEIGQRLAEASSKEPNLIGGLVAQTGFAVVHGAIVECLWSDAWQRDAASLRRLQAVIESWPVGEWMAKAVRGELVGFVGTLQWARDNCGEAGQEFGMPALALLPSGWFDANAAYAADLRDRTLLEAYRDGNDADVLSSVRRLESEIAGLNLVERLHRYVATFAMSSYQSIIEQTAYWEACRRQALIACALYSYRLDHGGTFPATLDALVPDFLAAVPADPIDGLPMRYAATAAGSFELYSIGYDGGDDGGALNLDPDRLERTRVQKSDYRGDWPWPVVPRPPEPSAEGEGEK